MLHFLYLLNKPQMLQNKNGIIVKVIALKQQMPEFYLQILSTEAYFYIYDRR